MDFDFLSNNIQIAYPFVTDVDVTRPSGSATLAPLMAALRYYTYDRREADLYVDEIDLRSSDGFTTLDTAKASLRWSDGTTVALEDAVTAEAKVYAYGAWVVVTWRRTVTSELPAVLHVVFPVAQVESDTFRFWKDTEDIVVLPSLVKQGPGKVRRVYIKRGSDLMEVAGPGDEVVLDKGFNMEVESTEEELVGGRQLTPVEINAVAGAGIGQYLKCVENAYLLTVNSVPPNENYDLGVKPEECYWLERGLATGPTPLPEPYKGITNTGTLRLNEFQLHNACGPCCSCEDYIATYNHMKAIWDRARLVSDGFYVLNSQWTAIVAAFVGIAEGLTGVLSLSQYDTDTETYLIMTVKVTNDSDADTVAAGVKATMTVNMSAGSYTYVGGSGIIASSLFHGLVNPTDPDGTPEVEFDFEFPPLSSATWTGLWKLSSVSAGDTVEVAAVISNGISDSETKELTIE